MELLDGLDAEQRAAVTLEAPVLSILAPAGSGKTRVLTRRIAWRRQEAGEGGTVLAITFTRAAAGELRERLHGLGVREGIYAATFHALARRELHAHADEHGGRAPDVLSDPLPLLREIDEASAAELRTEVAWARAKLVPPEGYPDAARAAGRQTRSSPERLAERMAEYAALKRKRRLADFDDLLERATDDLLGDPRWRERRRYWFRHVYVDEFQDLSALQFRYLRALVGDDPRLCVVGDPNQAVYGFNGADPAFLRRFPDHFPGASTVVLRNSYRSTPGIVEAATRVLRAADERVDVSAVREPGPLPTIAACDDPEAEAAHVARMVVDRHLPGHAWANQAVLARTRAQLDGVAAALAAVHVPHRVLGTDAAETPAMRRLLWRLRTSRLPYREALARMASDFERAGDDDDADASPTSPEIEALVAAADEYDRNRGHPTTSAFLSWLAVTAVVPAEADAVTLATFHAAKGLEWRVVHLAGVEDGLAPGWWATSPPEVAEERRLFYVACTRAHDELHITWARTRESRGRLRARRRSPYLDDLANALRDHERVHAPVDGRAELAAVREQLATRRARMAR